MYVKRPYNENICSRTGKIVPPLAKKSCFQERKTHNEMEKTLQKPEIDEPQQEMIESHQDEVLVTTTKVCTRCGRELPLDAFGKSWRASDGHKHICRECNGQISSKAQKAAYAKNPRKKKAQSSETSETSETSKETKKVLDLSTMEEAVMVDELRRRGWDVKCSKLIEL